jgi:hypothetical protein
MVLNQADLVFCIGRRMGTAAMAAHQNFIGDTPMIVVGYDHQADERYQGEDQRALIRRSF